MGNLDKNHVYVLGWEIDNTVPIVEITIPKSFERTGKERGAL